MYFRARYYNPLTGEFLSRDPMEFVDGMSLYRGYMGVHGIQQAVLLKIAFQLNAKSNLAITKKKPVTLTYVYGIPVRGEVRAHGYLGLSLTRCTGGCVCEKTGKDLYLKNAELYVKGKFFLAATLGWSDDFHFGPLHGRGWAGLRVEGGAELKFGGKIYPKDPCKEDELCGEFCGSAVAFFAARGGFLVTLNFGRYSYTIEASLNFEGSAGMKCCAKYCGGVFTFKGCEPSGFKGCIIARACWGTCIERKVCIG
jgi:hypothetical protein